jgi:hypothetical protein
LFHSVHSHWPGHLFSPSAAISVSSIIREMAQDYNNYLRLSVIYKKSNEDILTCIYVAPIRAGEKNILGAAVSIRKVWFSSEEDLMMVRRMVRPALRSIGAGR